MTTHKQAKKSEPGERVRTEPGPRLKPLKPGGECATPELASGMIREAASALRGLGRKRKDGDGDDPPGAG